MAFTLEKLLDAKRAMDAILNAPTNNLGTAWSPPNMFGGMPIRSDLNCLQDTDQRLFPASKHRSPRIQKKLVKRHGGVFRKAPAAFKTPHGIICHPALYERLKAAIPEQVG